MLPIDTDTEYWQHPALKLGPTYLCGPTQGDYTLITFSENRVQSRNQPCTLVEIYTSPHTYLLSCWKLFAITLMPCSGFGIKQKVKH